jgi:hypothetical protein
MRIIICLITLLVIDLPSSLYAQTIFDTGRFSAAQIGKQLLADWHPSILNQNLHQF